MMERDPSRHRTWPAPLLDVVCLADVEPAAPTPHDKHDSLNSLATPGGSGGQEKKSAGGKREGAGRPRRNGKNGGRLDTPQVFYMTTEQKEKIRLRAAFDGLSMSELLRQIVERYLL